MIIALVDDSEIERNKQITLFLEAFNELSIPVIRFDMFPSGEDFLDSWKPGEYDLILLDIIMGKFSGIDVAKKIREKNKDVRIVFCSTSNEYACESYTVGASYYLQKPVEKKNIIDMIKRLDIADFELRRFITLPNEKKLLLRDMISSEYSNHLITIHMKSSEDLKIWMSQSAFEELLKPFNFLISCAKGVMVNLYEVTEMNSDHFIMSDQSMVGISRRKKAEISTIYNDFLFNLVRTELI